MKYVLLRFRILPPLNKRSVEGRSARGGGGGRGRGWFTYVGKPGAVGRRCHVFYRWTRLFIHRVGGSVGGSVGG